MLGAPVTSCYVSVQIVRPKSNPNCTYILNFGQNYLERIDKHWFRIARYEYLWNNPLHGHFGFNIYIRHQVKLKNTWLHARDICR